MVTSSHPPAAAMPYALSRENARMVHAPSKKEKSQKSARVPIAFGEAKWEAIGFGGFNSHANKS
jgi:hypothetical protein